MKETLGGVSGQSIGPDRKQGDLSDFCSRDRLHVLVTCFPGNGRGEVLDSQEWSDPGFLGTWTLGKTCEGRRTEAGAVGGETSGDDGAQCGGRDPGGHIPMDPERAQVGLSKAWTSGQGLLLTRSKMVQIDHTPTETELGMISGQTGPVEISFLKKKCIFKYT